MRIRGNLGSEAGRLGSTYPRRAEERQQKREDGKPGMAETRNGDARTRGGCFERADITKGAAVSVTVLGPGEATLIERTTAAARGVDRRAARQKGMGESRATIVGQRADTWIGDRNLIGHLIQPAGIAWAFEIAARGRGGRDALSGAATADQRALKLNERAAKNSENSSSV